MKKKRKAKAKKCPDTIKAHAMAIVRLSKKPGKADFERAAKKHSKPW